MRLRRLRAANYAILAQLRHMNPGCPNLDRCGYGNRAPARPCAKRRCAGTIAAGPAAPGDESIGLGDRTAGAQFS